MKKLIIKIWNYFKYRRLARRHAMQHRPRNAEEYQTFVSISYCAKHGHSRIVYTKKGMIFCQWCDTLIGCAHCHKEMKKGFFNMEFHDGSTYHQSIKADDKVIAGANSKSNRERAKRLTSEDRMHISKKVLEQIYSK